MRIRLPTAQDQIASLKGILEPTVAPVTKLDREMVYPVRITRIVPRFFRALAGTDSNAYSISLPVGFALVVLGSFAMTMSPFSNK